jgi:alpha-galactosidase
LTQQPPSFEAMNRRQFIATGGTALGGLLLPPRVRGFEGSASSARLPPASACLSLPQTVTAKTDDRSFRLATVNRQEWGASGVRVKITSKHGALAVNIESTDAPLRSITLAWPHDHPPQARYLGDAWERAYGDLAWQRLAPKQIMPWYFLEHDGTSTRGFAVRTGCRAMCFWQAEPGAIKLVLDTRSGGAGVHLGRRRLPAAEIVTCQSGPEQSPFQATRALCHLMCRRPRLPRAPVVGSLDWYFTYGNSTARLFLEEAALFAKLTAGCGVKAFALVDSGWAPRDSHPDDPGWHDDQTRTRPFFGSMPDVATQVRQMGLVAGVWIRPLCAHPRDPAAVRLTRDHAFLDPSLPQNLERIRDLARLMRTWGFSVIKHDYTTFDLFGRWGPQLGSELTQDGWSFRHNGKTTAEIILDLYQALRQGCGDDGHLIACNALSHLSAGLTDYFRVGDDSGNNWDRARRFGPNPFAFRLPQHQAFYAIDPDCIGNLKEIPWHYNQQFIRLISESQALLQLSTRLGGIDEEQRGMLREAFRRLARPHPASVEPLDWLEHPLPARWQIGQSVVDMNWNVGNR